MSKQTAGHVSVSRGAPRRRSRVMSMLVVASTLALGFITVTDASAAVVEGVASAQCQAFGGGESGPPLGPAVAAPDVAVTISVPDSAVAGEAVDFSVDVAGWNNGPIPVAAEGNDFSVRFDVTGAEEETVDAVVGPPGVGAAPLEAFVVPTATGTVTPTGGEPVTLSLTRWAVNNFGAGVFVECSTDGGSVTAEIAVDGATDASAAVVEGVASAQCQAFGGGESGPPLGPAVAAPDVAVTISVPDSAVAGEAVDFSVDVAGWNNGPIPVAAEGNDFSVRFDVTGAEEETVDAVVGPPGVGAAPLEAFVVPTATGTVTPTGGEPVTLSLTRWAVNNFGAGVFVECSTDGGSVTAEIAVDGATDASAAVVEGVASAQCQAFGGGESGPPLGPAVAAPDVAVTISVPDSAVAGEAVDFSVDVAGWNNGPIPVAAEGNDFSVRFDVTGAEEETVDAVVGPPGVGAAPLEAFVVPTATGTVTPTGGEPVTLSLTRWAVNNFGAGVFVECSTDGGSVTAEIAVDGGTEATATTAAPTTTQSVDEEAPVDDDADDAQADDGGSVTAEIEVEGGTEATTTTAAATTTTAAATTTTAAPTTTQSVDEEAPVDDDADADDAQADVEEDAEEADASDADADADSSSNTAIVVVVAVVIIGAAVAVLRRRRSGG